MPVVSRLSTAAVKGTALHHHQKLQLSDNGMVDNRRFYLVDGRHRLFDGKQHGPLVRLKAEYDRNRRHLTLRFPENAAMEGSTTELGEAVHTDFYGRRVDGHLVEGPWAAALTAFVGEPRGRRPPR